LPVDPNVLIQATENYQRAYQRVRSLTDAEKQQRSRAIEATAGADQSAQALITAKVELTKAETDLRTLLIAGI